MPTSLQFPRRQFIAGSTAAVAGVSGNQTSLAESLNDRFGGWPVGIQSYSLRSFNVDEAIRHMRGLGLHFVEFYRKHVPLD